MYTMRKVKIVKSKLPEGVTDKNIADMFNQMIGAGGINMPVAYPRYLRIKNICENMIQIVSIFDKVIKCDAAAEIAQMTGTIDTVFSVDLGKYMPNVALAPQAEIDRFEPVYLACKKSALVATMITLYNNLLEYKAPISKEHWTWIVNAPAPIRLFPFTQWNIVELADCENVAVKRFVITSLSKLLEFGKMLFEELNAPDIDIDQFITIIRSNIEQLRRTPELHRCGKAFDKIIDSIGLLKSNFGEYYRDFKSSGQQTIIMENFILDVSKTTKADTETMRQFREIIKYYKKVAQSAGHSNNPKVKLLLDKVGENFADLEKSSELEPDN